MPKRALALAKLWSMSFSRFFSRLALAILISAQAQLGCSPTQALTDAGPSDSGGIHGSGGVQGGGGIQGGGGTDGGDVGVSCASLIADYAAALGVARSCSPFLENVQCTLLVSGSLQCGNCPVHVNDTTRLDEIRAAFQARTDCPPVACPAIACLTPGRGSCQPNDSESLGSCVDIR